MRQAFLALAAIAAVLSLGGTASRAHHYDNIPPGHSGYLYPADGLDHHEMNGRTSNGLSIPITVLYATVDWAGVLNFARPAWNAGLSPTTGFDVFSAGSGYVTVNSGTDIGQCGYINNDPGQGPAHGCPLGWFPDVPTAAIYMYAPAFYHSSPGNHKQSDLMHEMGHILFHAQEHYGFFSNSYNCSSIMGHCSTPVTAVQAHDVSDFNAAYRMVDAPNAAYGQLTSSSNLGHYFEGAYYTPLGNGLTLHAEKKYIFDRAINNVMGTYSGYDDEPRIVNNSDDGTPNSMNGGLPGSNTEWCFKVRGETGAIANTSEGYRFSPRSRAYCVARASAAVYTLSNRNDYVLFRLWNYSGSTINGAALLIPGTTTRVCDFVNVGNGQSPYCTWNPGSGSGYLEVWYNWQLQDTIGYDIRWEAHMKKLVFGTGVSLAIIGFFASPLAAFGQSPTDPVTTGTAVVTPIPEETLSPGPSATPFVWPTPGSDVLSTDASLQGSFVQDSDGDGRASESDQPATTLVELVRTGGGFSLFTAEDGSFVFKNLPSGDYLLMFWWGPGFIGVPTWETNAGLYVATISVSEDRTVRGVLPSTMLGNPKPVGLVPFPVRSGTDGGPIPVGSVDAGGDSPAPVGALPSTGSGSDASAWPLAVGLIGLAVAAAGMTLVAVKRRA